MYQKGIYYTYSRYCSMVDLVEYAIYALRIGVELSIVYCSLSIWSIEQLYVLLSDHSNCIFSEVVLHPQCIRAVK